ATKVPRSFFCARFPSRSGCLDATLEPSPGSRRDSGLPTGRQPPSSRLSPDVDSPQSMGLRRRVFVGLYAASGAAALVYEVTWTRLLTLQLGHTVAAASTVLAAFMGGLAAGAWMAGRWIAVRATPLVTVQAATSASHAIDAATRPTDEATVSPGASPFRVYALLEVTVALCAIALPFALAAARPALAWAY